MGKKFSVIVPVYNVEKYLDRCINSIVSQANDEIEVILIDDGSTDSSGSMCDVYAEKYDNIQVIHQKNQGLSAARNTGIENANGKYLYFIDSDDMIADGFFESMFDIIDRYENVDIIEFKYCREMSLGTYELSGTKEYAVLDKKNYINDLVKINIGNQIWFRLYRSILFKDIRFPIGRHYEDIPVFYKVALKSSKIIRVDYTYYIYNLTNLNSITKNIDLKTMKDLYKAANEFYDGLKTYCLDNSIDMDFLDYNRLSKYIHICYKLYQSKQTDNDLYREVKELLKKHKRIKLGKYKDFELKKMLVVMTLLKLKVM